MVSFAAPATSGNFNQAAFLESRPDIQPHGFDAWYNQYGQHEDPSQFEGFYSDVGVQPMDIEPLHQFERQAYTSMGQPERRPEMEQASQYLQQMMRRPTVSPQAVGLLGESADMYRSGAAPITMEEVEAQRSPYADALKSRLTQSGERARANILARQGTRGAASFGDTETGEEQGFLQEELLRKDSDIDAQTYDDAFNRLIQQREMQRQSGAGMGSLGTAAQGITSSGISSGISMADALYGAGSGITKLGMTEADRQLAAGQGIRGYNQGVLDRVSSDIIGQQNFAPQQIANIQSLLDFYKSNTDTSSTAGASTIQRLGGAATSAAPFADQLQEYLGF